MTLTKRGGNKYNDLSLSRLLLLLYAFVFTSKTSTADPIPANEEAGKCNNNQGTCKVISDCSEIFPIFHLIYDSVKFCDEFNDIVCCPNPAKRRVIVDTRRKFERECKSFSLIRGQCPTTPFIVNGIKAEPKEFPFMALIGLNKTNKVVWRCGGTLISRDYVLTAAHCLITGSESPEFHIRLGELDYDSTTDNALPQDFVATNYILHPGYDDDDDQHNDIALLQLNKEAVLNEYVMPACLSSTSGNEFTHVTAAGWGQTKDAGPSSSHLLKVTLNRFDDNICTEKLEDNQINVRTQICAGSFNSTADTCQGDSGGPIFVTHPVYRCMRQVVGVTSYGSICGNQNVPSIYTRVELYTDWIEKIVWRL